MLLSLCLYACTGPAKDDRDKNNKIIPPLKVSHKKTAEIGGIYFSSDNGNTWENVNTGLPQEFSIALGGIATSDKVLGVATKEYGVFLYNFTDSIWINVPTDQKIIENNLGALEFFDHSIYVGTKENGIFCSKDMGKTWVQQNKGLNNLTIRRFVILEQTLYVCTNDGFYALDNKQSSWKYEYGENLLQVNGATYFNGGYFIGTNKGVYQKLKDNHWINILPDHSVHNISSDEDELYAMTYNELLLASKDGANWRSIQNGLPENLYTFNVLTQNNTVFAGQWDGVYRKSKSDDSWSLTNSGIPEKFAATNLKSINGMLVISTAERKL